LNLDSFYLNCDDNKSNCILLKNIVVCVYNIAKNQNNNLYITGLILDTNLFTIPGKKIRFDKIKLFQQIKLYLVRYACI